MYTDYLGEIETRKTQALSPKPIEDGALLEEIVSQIKDAGNEHRDDALKFLIYNTLPGTTSAADVKARFLKEIILGEAVAKEISPAFAFELLSHMKGGPSVEVLLDLALGGDDDSARQAADVLKTQVFLYEADTDRLTQAYEAGNEAPGYRSAFERGIFHQTLYRGRNRGCDLSRPRGYPTDLLSPGNQAHSRSDRELHGKSMISRPHSRKSALPRNSIQTSA